MSKKVYVCNKGLLMGCSNAVGWAQESHSGVLKSEDALPEPELVHDRAPFPRERRCHVLVIDDHLGIAADEKRSRKNRRIMQRAFEVGRRAYRKFGLRWEPSCWGQKLFWERREPGGGLWRSYLSAWPVGER